MLYAQKLRAETVFEWGKHRFRNLFMVIGLLVVLTVTTLFGILLQIGAISFKSMILFKGLNLNISFMERLKEYWELIADQLSIYFVYLIVEPALYLVTYFADLKLNYEFVAITCPGASSPFELGLNMGILGIAVVLVGSDIQVFKQVTYNAYIGQKSSMVMSTTYIKWHLTKGNGGLFNEYCSGLYSWLVAMCIFFLEKLARIDVFQTALQYLMSLVTLQVFVSNGGIHEVDPACNTVKGFEGYDTYIATLTSGIFYVFFIPNCC